MKWIKSTPTKEMLEKVAQQYGAVVCGPGEDPKIPYDLKKESDVVKNDVQIPIGEGKFINLAGLQNTSDSFSGLLNPICKYAFARLLDDSEKPLFFTANSFLKYPGTCEIPVDVDKTETVTNDACLIYPDKILTIAESYGVVTVTCYAKDKLATKEIIGNLGKKMRKENQYKGKCLFFSDETIVFRDTPTVDWDDVVLTAKSKNEIKINTVDFLTNKKFAELGINRRGLILYGPPGTGKTMMVKSLFNQMKTSGVTRIYATADTFTYPGIVTNLFDFLKFTGKTVLAFEDMDLISPDRSDGSGRKVLGALLNNLDGIRKMDDALVVIGTTNDIAMIDQALSNRPCRFDRKIEIPLPGEDEVKKFFSMLIGNNVSNEIIGMSKGFSGAHIKEAVNTAKLLAAETGSSIDGCLKDACSIIKDNFFPMTKEASTKLYKNKEGKMSKKAQVSLITPFIMNPGGQNYSLIPLFRLFKRPSEFTNKEATSLWKIWKEHQGKIDNNKIALDKEKYSDSIRELSEGKLIMSDDDGKYELTAKGKKLLRSLILTTEVNTFEKNAKEPDEIDIDAMENKIHGSSNKKIKKVAGKSENKNPLGDDWYFNAIKNIKKED